jgi:hypothetical protein
MHNNGEPQHGDRDKSGTVDEQQRIQRLYKPQHLQLDSHLAPVGACVCMRQHTSATVSYRQHLQLASLSASGGSCVREREDVRM